MTDRSGTASHEKRLALYRPGDKDGAMRGHRRHAQGRSQTARIAASAFVTTECTIIFRRAQPAATSPQK
jgi:hypothetical protein